MARQSTIPEELFHAVVALMPRLVYVAEDECKIQPVELLTLWHLRRFGKPNASGQHVCLRSELTEALRVRFRFSAPTISKLLEDLQDRDFILRTAISSKQRAELFGGDTGAKLVVILMPKGNDKIEEFIDRVSAHGERWLAGQPAMYRKAARAFAPIAMQFAKWLIDRYGPDGVSAQPPIHPSNDPNGR